VQKTGQKPRYTHYHLTETTPRAVWHTLQFDGRVWTGFPPRMTAEALRHLVKMQEKHGR
jgi:hypothetical protein